jgi:phenylacetic acid degradation operon negative regulatory protein
LLPPALLPNDWVGSTAYDLCANLYAKVFAAAEEFLTGMASSLEGASPPADSSVYARFGGIPR